MKRAVPLTARHAPPDCEGSHRFGPELQEKGTTKMRRTKLAAVKEKCVEGQRGGRMGGRVGNQTSQPPGAFTHSYVAGLFIFFIRGFHMFHPLRAIGNFFKRLFSRRDTTAATERVQTEAQFAMKSPAEPERSVGQTVVKIYRTTNEVAGAIMLPDKMEQCFDKLMHAKHKVAWAATHKKLVLAKVHGFFSSLWHAAGGWIAKAAACLSSPGVIAAAVVVIVGVVFIVAMMHGGGAV